MANQLAGHAIDSAAGTSTNSVFQGTTDADTTITLDLRESDRAVPPVVGLVIGITGTVALDVTGGATVEDAAAVSDVVGKELSSLSASATYWIDVSAIRYLILAVNVTDVAAFSYYIIY